MAALPDKVQNSLDEVRMLVLAAQVLLGLQFRTFFEPAFDRLSPFDQRLQLFSLGALLAGMALLFLPAAYHRIVERGDDSERLLRFVSASAFPTLVPFAFALAVDVEISFQKVLGKGAAWLCAAVMAAIALSFFYGIEFAARLAGKGERHMPGNEKSTELSKKIKHVLTEARVLIPGAQALVGFQFAITLMDAFDKLPGGLKRLHLLSLALIGLSLILLLTPAAWHRIVERGEETERFHRFATAMLLSALVPMALGMSADFYVVLMKVLHSVGVATAGALGLLALMFGLWFVYTNVRRAQLERRGELTAQPAR